MKSSTLIFNIPSEVSRVTDALKKSNFEAYLVGGCVRDLVLGQKPRDWDITTNAKPDEIQGLFKETFYENDYGTVGVVSETEDETLKVIEITPFRLEAKYSDKRRPDSVSFSGKLEDDLKRRDFTINAMALNLVKKTSKGHECELVDLYKGQDDIRKKVVRTVGEADLRFGEDALRMLRGIRIATELGFVIESETAQAIFNNAKHLQEIASERIRDELVRIIMSKEPMAGLVLSQKLGVLKYVLPELEEGIGVKQNKAHSYDVFEHILRTVGHSAKKNYPLHVRLASLFHDIGKPATRRWSPEKNDWTFHGHDVVGAKIAAKAMERLKFGKKDIEKVTKLVRWHMFFSDTETITLSAVRRMVRNVGHENIWDLMNVRICDRIGTGRPKESPYRLRKYNSMVEEAMRDPVTVGMLKINGGKIMEVAGLAPGPKIGFILHALLEEVLEKPELNSAEYLEKKSILLAKLPESELKKLGEEGKEKRIEIEEREVGEIRKKYFVE